MAIPMEEFAMKKARGAKRFETNGSGRGRQTNYKGKNAKRPRHHSPGYTCFNPNSGRGAHFNVDALTDTANKEFDVKVESSNSRDITNRCTKKAKKPHAVIVAEPSEQDAEKKIKRTSSNASSTSCGGYVSAVESDGSTKKAVEEVDFDEVYDEDYAYEFEWGQHQIDDTRKKASLAAFIKPAKNGKKRSVGKRPLFASAGMDGSFMKLSDVAGTSVASEYIFAELLSDM